MKTRFLALLTLAFSVLFVLFAQSSTALAQNTRHPRVAELEKTLAHDGLELLKGRFPDKPFLIKVKIDPLFRDRPRGDRGDEKLPYLDVVDDEITDEWDDPSVHAAILLDRVKRIFVNASVPANLSDDEISELKETLISNLGMIAGRDSVEISKRSWGTSEKDDGAFNRNTITWTIVGFILFSVGLLIAAWLITSRLGKAFKSSQKSTGEKAAAAPMPSAPMPVLEAPRRDAPAFGDIKMSDPLKNREMLALGMRTLEGYKGFPSLDDMLILHKFGQESPSDLGALVCEFPPHLRAKVFSYSHGEFWLHGLSEPCEVNSASVEVLNKCLRVQRKESDSELDELRILIWRLQDKSAEFFRGIDQGEAFSLMFDLPKNMSLSIARNNYPGSWGMLLNPNFKPQSLDADRIRKLKERALGILELRDLSSLAKFKKQSDLLEYLKFSDSTTEKEIYIAAGASSMLPTIRPPFYKIFEMSEDAIKLLVPMMRIEDWAVALLNVERKDRKLFEAQFGEKQRYKFLELLKAFDSQPPSRELTGDTRARAGRLAAEVEKSLLTESVDALNALNDLEDLETPKAA